MLHKSFYDSPLGKLIILSNDQSILGLWFADQKHFGAKYDLDEAKDDDSQPIELAKIWLDNYFAGRQPTIANLPLTPEVTPFRQEVLSVLKTIPYGSTLTYQEIAEKIAQKTGRTNVSPRAVGGAVGHNPISIIIPCHRVIGKDGSLTGYAGGLSRKIKLLQLENVAV